MGTLVDTSVFVAIERDEPGSAWLQRYIETADNLCVNPIIIAELQLGVHMAKSVPLALARQRTLDRAAQTTLLPIGFDTAVQHATITAQLWQSKKMRPRSNDVWIAATAVEHNLEVLTANPNDFSDLLGVRVVPAVRPALAAAKPPQ